VNGVFQAVSPACSIQAGKPKPEQTSILGYPESEPYQNTSLSAEPQKKLKAFRKLPREAL
jgi:hypothetical protein